MSDHDICDIYRARFPSSQCFTWKQKTPLNPKGAPPVRFLTSEVESFSTRNVMTFPDIKCRIRTKILGNLLLGSRDMTIFGEWAS